MKSSRLKISRGGQELGELSQAEIIDLLNIGFLLPTDCFRDEQNSEWRCLGELQGNQPQRAETFATVKTVAGKVRRSASDAAAKLASMKNRGSTAIGTTAARLLEDYLPTIRASVLEIWSTSTRSVGVALGDEAFLKKLFAAAYDTLPKPVTRFVGEQQFVEFCLKHRSKLLINKD